MVENSLWLAIKKSTELILSNIKSIPLLKFLSVSFLLEQIVNYNHFSMHHFSFSIYAPLTSLNPNLKELSYLKRFCM